MTRRFLMSALITTLILGVTTAAVRAGDEPLRERTADTATTVQPLERDAERLRPVQGERVRPLGRRLARCNSLKCINRTFKKVIRAHNALADAHNALVVAHNSLGGAHTALESLVLDCFGTLGATQFGEDVLGDPGTNFGYMWDDNADGDWESADNDLATTALDLDDPALSQFLLLAFIC